MLTRDRPREKASVYNQQDRSKLARDFNIESRQISLSNFFRDSWHVLEPSTDLAWNWHIEAICDHIQELFFDWLKHREDPQYIQRARNLVINIPPGSAKSRVISVCTPAWIWTYYPSFKMIFLSANPRVALRDSVLCRDLIESEWYQTTFKPSWELRSDQNAKSSYWNTAGGFRNANGFNSRITGSRADCLTWDDPHDAEEVNSDALRLAVIERWDNAIRNRVNDPKSSIRLGIMQRLHDGDLTGHVDKSGEWEKLVIPQEFEGDKTPTFTGWRDPRTEQGELMFPDRFPRSVVEQEKKNLGSYGYAGQHQQRPVPREGGMIKLAWFQRYSVPPANPEKVVISWDTASKAKELSCPWVCGVWSVYQGNYYLLYVFRKQMEYPEGRRTAFNLALQWNPDEILIEDKSTGQSLIQEFKLGVVESGLKRYFNIIPVQPDADKVTRIATESTAIEAGRVFLPESASWLPDYELEMTTCPNCSTFDQVDMTSQFLKRMKGASPADKIERMLQILS